VQLLRKVAPHLSSAQALALLGDLLADLIPHLEKHHFLQAGDLFRQIDPNREGWDDAAADLAYKLGGRSDLAIPLEAGEVVTLPPLPPEAMTGRGHDEPEPEDDDDGD
jgi:hypothetical protein